MKETVLVLKGDVTKGVLNMTDLTEGRHGLYWGCPNEASGGNIDSRCFMCNMRP
jgi:hypothetical protein